ncbi:hypothetical protein PsAD14_04659 [Pseudovibrio sp. Ad14]|nr:hypothetical protein PsW74_03969 [Pseudovibrio sp. W74]KZL06212.1 hypothetical protein PsAD14_04659 [Pseudovibrio sp. Ad14]
MGTTKKWPGLRKMEGLRVSVSQPMIELPECPLLALDVSNGLSLAGVFAVH